MKIIRNGVVIELTSEERYDAWAEFQKRSHKCDIVDAIKGYCIDDDPDSYDGELICDDEAEFEIGKAKITGAELKEKLEDDEFINGLVDKLERALNHNDLYYDVFWGTVRSVIEAEFKGEK